MLTSSQMATAISAILAGAVLLGWILHWLWSRAHRRARGNRSEVAEMAERLHSSDDARAQAIEAREQAENLLASRENEMQARYEAMQHRLDGAIEGREAELATELREARAEAEAAMSGLGNARRRIGELEAALADRSDEGTPAEVGELRAQLDDRDRELARLAALLEEHEAVKAGAKTG